MKHLALTLIAAATLTGTAFATPDVIELPATMGKISFPHKKHEDALKDCKKCHEKTPGKIKELNKEWAHKTCKGCHADMKKGPVLCRDCHKK